MLGVFLLFDIMLLQEKRKPVQIRACILLSSLPYSANNIILIFIMLIRICIELRTDVKNCVSQFVPQLFLANEKTLKFRRRSFVFHLR